MKRDKLDAVFSDLTRWRANWQCEVCGAGREAHLQCSHIFGRAKISIRWHPDNSLCLCHHCHLIFTQHPLLHAEFIRGKFGVTFYDQLMRLANRPRHFSKADKEAIYQAYKIALAQMKTLRATGHFADSEYGFDRIPFQFPDLTNVLPLARKRKPVKGKKGTSRKLTNPKFKKKVDGTTVARAA